MGYDRKLDRNRAFDSVAELTADGNLGINEYFLEYIYSTNPKDQADELLQQLLLQQNEKMTTRRDKSHPFHGDEEGFDRYCRGKYRPLYESIIAMIDMHSSRR